MVTPLLPEMTDMDAAIEIEEMLVLGVENKGLDASADTKFKTFRQNLRSRIDLSDVKPVPVDRNRDLAAFWSYCKSYDPSWAPRRKHIRDEFSPLFQRLENQATNPPQGTVDSARWTGRRTVEVQAKVVLSLAPNAIAGLEDLLEQIERPYHNGGPRDLQTENALKALRELHCELGELIVAAEQGIPLSDKLEKLMSLKRSVFKWSAENFSMTTRGLPLAGTTAVIGCGVSYIINVIAGMPIGSAAAIGAASAAANAAYIVKQTPEKSKE